MEQATEKAEGDVERVDQEGEAAVVEPWGFSTMSCDLLSATKSLNVQVEGIDCHLGFFAD